MTSIQANSFGLSCSRNILSLATGVLACIGQAQPAHSRLLSQANPLIGQLGFRLGDTEKYCQFLNTNDDILSVRHLLSQTQCDNNFIPVNRLPDAVAFTDEFSILNGNTFVCGEDLTASENVALECLQSEVNTPIQAFRDRQKAKAEQKAQQAALQAAQQARAQAAAEAANQAKAEIFAEKFKTTLPLSAAVGSTGTLASVLVGFSFGVMIDSRLDAAAPDIFPRNNFLAIGLTTLYSLAEHASGLAVMQAANGNDALNFEPAGFYRSALGSTILAGAATLITLAMGGAQSPSLQDREGYAAVIGLKIVLLKLLQSEISFLIGSQALDGDTSKFRSDFTQNMAGALALPALIAVTALTVTSLQGCFTSARAAAAPEGAAAGPMHPRQQARVNNANPVELELADAAQFQRRNPDDIQIVDGVHDPYTRAIAREQVKALKTLDASLQKHAPESDELTLSSIMHSIDHAPTNRNIADKYQVKSAATEFMQTLNNNLRTFQREFADLQTSPEAIIAMIWRASMASMTSTADEAGPSKPSQALGLQAMAAKLVEQMAQIATTIHGVDSQATNPCGSGKVESLLQFAATYLPALNLFANKFVAVPENLAVQNEFYADFNRAVHTMPPVNAADQAHNQPQNQLQKEYLYAIYVTQQDKMTPEVFEQMYANYQQQLLA